MKITVIFVLLALVALSTSCSKCETGNLSTGEIIENSIVRSWSNAPGQRVIRSANNFGAALEVSLNEGQSYSPVNFELYSVLAFPTVSNCAASFIRDVTFDEANQMVIYKITITNCPDCTGQVQQSNFVLTRKIPENFTVNFELVNN
ncbi:MAG: hypothetical protein JJT77_05890 [Crocinitomicaceae bacterium]|nr:hypothetical protein [Crocinitomicaceae bacterium]